MKRIITFFNILLIIMIPIVFVLAPFEGLEKSVIKTDVEIKKLESGLLKLINNNEEIIDKEEVELDNGETNDEIEVKEEKKSIVSSSANVQKKEVEVEVVVPEKETIVIEEKNSSSDVLEVQTGKMSGYGPDCRGCSGYLSSGRYVGDGNVYYNDKTYGQVRILAGDTKYKFGTIVRIKNSRAGNNILGIVLDRGGSIGIGKKFVFDLLYPTEALALKDEVSYNVEFEILRYGY